MMIGKLAGSPWQGSKTLEKAWKTLTPFVVSQWTAREEMQCFIFTVEGVRVDGLVDRICWRLACYDIIGIAQGAISSTKGQHVTRITCCDWSHAYATGVAHQWLICNWSCTYASELQICDKPSCKYTGRTLGGHAHQNSIYRRPSGPHFFSPSHVLLYFYASNIDHPFTTKQYLSSARDNRHIDYNHYQGVATHRWQQPISPHSYAHIAGQADCSRNILGMHHKM